MYRDIINHNINILSYQPALKLQSGEKASVSCWYPASFQQLSISQGIRRRTASFLSVSSQLFPITHHQSQLLPPLKERLFITDLEPVPSRALFIACINSALDLKRGVISRSVELNRGLCSVIQGTRLRGRLMMNAQLSQHLPPFLFFQVLLNKEYKREVRS